MKTMLTEENFKMLKVNQGKLDDDICEQHNISIGEWEDPYMMSKRYTALRVETHEFINECYDIWKYWKKKPVKPELILEEAIDVIHFIISLCNTHALSEFRIKLNLEKIEEAEKVSHEVFGLKGFHPMMYVDRLISGSEEDDHLMIDLHSVLKLLEHYEFTADDIMNAYDEKNKENYRRLRSGY